MANFGERDRFEAKYDHEEDAQRDKYLTFKLGSEEYGVEIRFVTEIIGIQKITILPDMPEFIKGIINLRGRVVPAIDMRLRFIMEEIPYGERTCIIVVEINDTLLGLIVDEVSEVIDIPEQNIDSPPKASAKNQKLYIKGLGKVGDDVKIILNLDSILTQEELQGLTEIK